MTTEPNSPENGLNWEKGGVGGSWKRSGSSGARAGVGSEVTRVARAQRVALQSSLIEKSMFELTCATPQVKITRLTPFHPINQNEGNRKITEDN